MISALALGLASPIYFGLVGFDSCVDSIKLSASLVFLATTTAPALPTG